MFMNISFVHLIVYVKLYYTIFSFSNAAKSKLFLLYFTLLFIRIFSCIRCLIYLFVELTLFSSLI